MACLAAHPAGVPLPDLHLHPWHLQDLVRLQTVFWGKLEPAPLRVFKQASLPVDVEREAEVEAACLPEVHALPRLRLQLPGGTGAALCSADSAVPFPPVPLLLAEVHLGRDVEYGLPLLAVTAHPEAGAIPGSAATGWLLLVAGGAAAGRCALHHLGRAGAVLHDFAMEFGLADAPLGKGSQAATFRLHPRSGSLREHAELVAKVPLPHVKAGDAGTGAALPRNVCSEVRMLVAVAGHPHIVDFMGLFCSAGGIDKPERPEGREPAWAIVMGLCGGGDLCGQVQLKALAEDRAKHVTWDLLSALAHIHSRRIIHRDVKPENVLLEDGGRAVLADFGIACREEDENEVVRRCGTPGYAAPEVVRGQPYGVKVDMFGAGVTLFFILSRRVPFRGSCTRSTLKRTMQCEVDFGHNRHFDSVSEECKDVILHLLAKDCHNRISATEAQTHAWFHKDLSNTSTQCSLGTLARSASSSSQHGTPSFSPKSVQSGEFFEQSPRRRHSYAYSKRCNTMSRFSLTSSALNSSAAFSSSARCITGSTGGDLPPYLENETEPIHGSRSHAVDHLGMSFVESLSRGRDRRITSPCSTRQTEQLGDAPGSMIRPYTPPEQPYCALESLDKEVLMAPKHEICFDSQYPMERDITHAAKGSKSSRRRSAWGSVGMRLSSMLSFRSTWRQGHRHSAPTQGGHLRRLTGYMGLRVRRHRVSSLTAPNGIVSTVPWRSILTSPVHFAS